MNFLLKVAGSCRVGRTSEIVNKWIALYRGTPLIERYAAIVYDLDD